MNYQGRLELTWTNKHLRLLADEDGGYEWVPAADYRVSEVRLLHNSLSIGPVFNEQERARDNLLRAYPNRSVYGVTSEENH